MCVEDSANGQFVIPHSGYMTSKFGPRWGRSHQGVDIGLKTGEMVRSAWNGRVRYAKFNEGGYGNLVVVRHYNGFETYYAHLSKLLVSPNQEVKAGDVIGLGGNTGHSFGAHLHFEVRFFDVAINPEHIIDFASRNIRDENVMVHKNIFQVKLPGGYKKSSVKEEEHDHDHEFPKKEIPTKSVIKEYKRYYSVRSGDNLSKIADRNRTTVEKLCQLNGLKASRVLEVGTSIRVK
ncbi:MAG: LysM peptidoglycan-binding domain-containing protein [Crocinitomicaceae bacterium]|nr:LysM peptidoglycan-binding domain-containing protein [Crocinitomicaceae bacterium]